MLSSQVEFIVDWYFRTEQTLPRLRDHQLTLVRSQAGNLPEVEALGSMNLPDTCGGVRRSGKLKFTEAKPPFLNSVLSQSQSFQIEKHFI